MPEAKAKGGRLSIVKQVLLLEWMLISHLMSMKGVADNEVNVTSRLVRLFLTHFYDHEESMGLDKKHKWLSSYNFLDLLNLPNQIQMLGPICNRWEGGVRGEGFVRLAKPLIHGTSRINWQKNLLSNLVKHKSLSVLSNPGSRPTVQMGLDSSSVKMYLGPVEVLAHLKEKVPISVVVASACTEEISLKPLRNDGREEVDFPTGCPLFFAVCKVGKEKCLLLLMPVGGSRKRMGVVYHELGYGAGKTVPPSSVTISGYALLLPMDGQKLSENLFSINSDDWRVLDADYRMAAPHTYIDLTEKNWQD